MKYLSISPTVMVRMDSIDAIEMSEDGSARVYVDNKTFESFIPMVTFMEMLNSSSGVEESMASDIRQLRNNSQFYGG